MSIRFSFALTFFVGALTASVLAVQACGGRQSSTPDALDAQTPIADANLVPDGDAEEAHLTGTLALSFFTNATKSTAFIGTLAANTPNASPFHVTSGSFVDHSPSFSADGKQIVFVRYDDSGALHEAALTIVNSDGTGLRRLATCGLKATDCASPLFGADGNVWFIHTPYDGSTIARVPVAGGAITKWFTPDVGCSLGSSLRQAMAHG